MSWSIFRVGKALAVKEAVQVDASKIKLVESEQKVFEGVVAAIVTALNAFSGDSAVEVTANGSISYVDWSTKEGECHQVSLTIRPIYGFLG